MNPFDPATSKILRLTFLPTNILQTYGFIFFPGSEYSLVNVIASVLGQNRTFSYIKKVHPANLRVCWTNTSIILVCFLKYP